jgi:hypothetical protein
MVCKRELGEDEVLCEEEEAAGLLLLFERVPVVEAAAVWEGMFGISLAGCSLQVAQNLGW